MAFAKGRVPWNKGSTTPEKTRQKLSETRIRLFAEGKIIPWNKGVKNHVQRKCLQCGKLFYVNPCILKRKGGGKYCSRKCYGMSISGKGNYWYGRKQHAPWLAEFNRRLDTRQKLSELHKKLCQDPEFVKDLMKRLGQAGKKPNKSEQLLESMLQKHFPNKWRYVGNAKLIIGGECPDFWDGDGGLIELFGEYWHKPEEEKERIDFFNKRGYNCLVIWVHELKDEASVAAKVADFLG